MVSCLSLRATYRKLDSQFLELNGELLKDRFAEFVTTWDVFIRQAFP